MRLDLKDLSTLEDLKPLLLTESEYRTEQTRSSSLFLISIALVVLVIACANISGLLLLMINEGQLNLDFEDVIINDCCITHQGEIRGRYKDEIK